MIAQLLHRPTPSTTFARVLKHVGLPLGGVHWLGLRFRPPPSRTASVEPSSPSRGCDKPKVLVVWWRRGRSLTGARQAATPPSRVRCGAGFFGSSPSAPPSFASGPSLGARDLPSVGNRVFRPPARPPPMINYVIRRAGAPSPAEPAAEMGPTGSPAPRRASVRRRWLSARLDLC